MYNEVGYAGLPYDAADPITAEDARRMLSADPVSYPKLQDALEPMPGTNPTPNPLNTPTTVTTPGANGSTTTTTVVQPGAAGAASTTTVTTTTTNNYNLDLGADPGISRPELEDTPTIAMILVPIIGVMGDLRGFQVPAHQSTCPTFNFVGTKYGDIHDDSMCRSIEDKRSLLSTIALAIWVWVAFRVFTR
jgi:hypothetical protein